MLFSKQKVLSREKIRTLLSEEYTITQKKIKVILKGKYIFSISTDGWTSFANMAYVTCTAHFINQELGHFTQLLWACLKRLVVQQLMMSLTIVNAN